MRSSPAPPRRRSLPLLPVSWSSPLSPHRRSAAVPPLMRSLPGAAAGAVVAEREDDAVVARVRRGRGRRRGRPRCGRRAPAAAEPVVAAAAARGSRGRPCRTARRRPTGRAGGRWPLPPLRWSRSGPPVRRSLPVPPKSRSARRPPRMPSLPPRPWRRSGLRRAEDEVAAGGAGLAADDLDVARLGDRGAEQRSDGDEGCEAPHARGVPFEPGEQRVASAATRRRCGPWPSACAATGRARGSARPCGACGAAGRCAGGPWGSRAGRSSARRRMYWHALALELGLDPLELGARLLDDRPARALELRRSGWKRPAADAQAARVDLDVAVPDVAGRPWRRSRPGRSCTASCPC